MMPIPSQLGAVPDAAEEVDVSARMLGFTFATGTYKGLFAALILVLGSMMWIGWDIQATSIRTTKRVFKSWRTSWQRLGRSRPRKVKR